MKAGWKYRKLGDIATDMYRGAGIKRDQITGSGYPCIRYGEIYTTYSIAFDKCVSHTVEENIKPRKYFEYGDLLFAITGESVEDIGKTIAYLGHEKCLLGGDIVCMKHNEDPKYLAYALSSKEAIRQKGIGKTKLKVVHTNIPSLKEITIPVPSLDEQRSIVTRLDAAFARIEALKTNANRQLAEARALFNRALKEEMIPKEGWKERAFENCINKIPKQRQVKSIDYRPEGNYPIVSQEKELISGYWDDESYLYKHEKPIIVFGDHTKEIKYIDFDFVVGADGTQLLSLKDGINTKFFYYVLLNTPIRTLGYARHFKLLKEKTFFIPSFADQHAIVSRLDALSANVRKLEEVWQKTLLECDALKQAMLKEVFE